MNRDEKVSRGAGFPPVVRRKDTVRIAHPDDGNSGTWIGVNEFGIALAVLNWNEPTPSVVKSKSRGCLIPKLLSAPSIADLAKGIEDLELRGMLPFRLIAVAPADGEIFEWRWDSFGLVRYPHSWQADHWFSSSLSDRQAEETRSGACLLAWDESDAGSSTWLRRLHASHTNDVSGPSPFSLCVHRSHVQTLSYSEVECSSSGIRLGHRIGSPCSLSGSEAYELEFERQATPVREIRN